MIEFIVTAFSWLVKIVVCVGIIAALLALWVAYDNENERRRRDCEARARARRVAAAMKRREEHHQRALIRRERERQAALEQARRQEEARWNFSVPLGGAILSPAPLVAGTAYRVDVTAGESRSRVIDGNGRVRQLKAEIPVIAFDAEGWSCPLLEFDPTGARRVTYVVPGQGRKLRILASSPGDYFDHCERLNVKIAPLDAEDAKVLAALEAARVKAEQERERARLLADEQARRAEEERRRGDAALREQRIAKQRARRQRAWVEEARRRLREREERLRREAEERRRAAEALAAERARRLRELEDLWNTGGAIYATAKYINGHACTYSDRLDRQRAKIITETAEWHRHDPEFVDLLKRERPELYVMATWQARALAVRDELAVRPRPAPQRLTRQQFRARQLQRKDTAAEDAAQSLIAMVLKEVDVAARLDQLPIDDDQREAVRTVFRKEARKIYGAGRTEQKEERQDGIL